MIPIPTFSQSGGATFTPLTEAEVLVRDRDAGKKPEPPVGAETLLARSLTDRAGAPDVRLKLGVKIVLAGASTISAQISSLACGVTNRGGVHESPTRS